MEDFFQETNLKEEKGDLFSVDDDSPIFAHCVSSDGKMGAGIAQKFVNRYGSGLRTSVKKFEVGDAAPYNKGNVKIYNLITKENYWEKPTYKSIQFSLESLRNRLVENGEKKIYMPRIASGLDGKNWKRVKGKIKDVFNDSNIQITIRHL